MREILFRGKRKNGTEWVYGNYCGAEYLSSSGIEHLIIEIPRNGCSAQVDPETVGQYTGLTDKNGKKIFTKDILAITAFGDDHHQKGVKTIAVVEDYMGNTCLCIDGKHQTGTTLYDIIIAHTVEVIGDATDNPELLKGGG